jgi:hypothetical protein
VADRRIPGRVPVGVVDLLEVIDVDHDQGQRGRGAPGACHLQAQRLDEASAVGETRQIVGGGELREGREQTGVLHSDRDLLP